MTRMEIENETLNLIALFQFNLIVDKCIFTVFTSPIAPFHVLA